MVTEQTDVCVKTMSQSTLWRKEEQHGNKKSNPIQKVWILAKGRVGVYRDTLDPVLHQQCSLNLESSISKES